jgi:hypothetical protein
MTESEKKQMYIANCQACLIAQVMKTCPLCNFNIGLPYRKENQTQQMSEVKPSTDQTKV